MQKEEGGAHDSTMTPEEKKVQERFMLERRLLLACTALVALSVILWSAAISTDYWFMLRGGDGIWIDLNKRYFLRSNSGIWRICRATFTNGTSPGKNMTSTARTLIGASGGAALNNTSGLVGVSANPSLINSTMASLINDTKQQPVKIVIMRKCTLHEMVATDAEISLNPSLDKTILNYNRSEASFAIISLLMLLMGCFFSIYTFRNPRYTFKRLAGGIHFITCGSVLAVIEVVIGSIEHERKHLPHVYPPGAQLVYGYSIVLAWLVFVFVLTSGFAFMIFSRKRKGARAPNEEMAMADEPTIIGR